MQPPLNAGSAAPATAIPLDPVATVIAACGAQRATRTRATDDGDRRAETGQGENRMDRVTLGLLASLLVGLACGPAGASAPGGSTGAAAPAAAASVPVS